MNLPDKYLRAHKFRKALNDFYLPLVLPSIYLKVIRRHGTKVQTLRKIENRSRSCLPHLEPHSISSKANTVSSFSAPSQQRRVGGALACLRLCQYLRPSPFFMCDYCVTCTALYFDILFSAHDLSEVPFHCLGLMSRCLTVKMD